MKRALWRRRLRLFPTFLIWSVAPAAFPAEASAERWWAYQDVARPEAPPVKHPAWALNPIDRFILAKLEARGLEPVPPAGAVALVRRAYYDLVGLPPRPDEIDAFASDPAPDAYERLIDRLLASPHHGEKWGRHWLDLVRYAETNGYERDGDKPQVWRYRDYVIRSINADKPYDRFIREQLAGDELEPRTADSIVATGYYRLGLWDDEAVDMLQARYDELDDVVATTAQVFLGTTINCARCHDHKADPVPQEDYYRFLAFFQDIPRYGERQVSNKHVLTDITDLGRSESERRRLEAQADRRASILAEAREIEDVAIRRMPADDQHRAEGPERTVLIAEKLKEHLEREESEKYERLRLELAAVERGLKVPLDLALSVNNCAVEAPETHVLLRGSAHAPAGKVAPGFPRVLDAHEPMIKAPGGGQRSAGRRRVLADWIASAGNRLTTRVAANRLWQHHFGRGIVRSSNDFGRLGERPTHPELLDWLATELARQAWSLKALHRLILTSSAYRMSSGDAPDALARDPANDLFWRFDMRRLTAEEVRDSVLAVNGSLNLAMGGSSVYTEVPAAVLHTASRPGDAWGSSPPAERDRRSVYVFVKRSLIEPILGAFDLADPDGSCAVRFTTTVPTQALTSLNGDFFGREARRFAGRLRRDAGPDRMDQVRLALRLTTGREPANGVVERGARMLAALEEEDRLDGARALEYYCLMVLNLNELVYLD